MFVCFYWQCELLCLSRNINMEQVSWWQNASWRFYLFTSELLLVRQLNLRFLSKHKQWQLQFGDTSSNKDTSSNQRTSTWNNSPERFEEENFPNSTSVVVSYSACGNTQDSLVLMNNAVQAAVRWDALGVLLCDWSLPGHVNPLSVSVPAFLAGTGLAWKASTEQVNSLTSNASHLAWRGRKL